MTSASGSEVISFYNETLKGEGFVPFIDKLGTRKWEEIYDLKAGALIKNKRFAMSWHDSSKSTYVLVALFYYAHKGDGELSVSCNAYPYNEILRSIELM